MSEPLVSIIMPVYNAEKTLRISLTSLKKQTYGNLEVLLIDDGSTDGSLALLNNFKREVESADLHFKVVILSRGENRGVAAARNIGLEEAKGDYVYYLDADDWIEEEAIEKMVQKLRLSNADIVGVNWWLSFKTKEKLMKQPFFEKPHEVLRLMLIGRMRWNLWLFMVRRELYVKHQIRFIDGVNMGEDILVMFRLFGVAKKVVCLDESLYHYGQSNEESLTKTYSEEHRKQVTRNVDEMKRYLVASGHKRLIDEWLPCFKLNVKLPLLVTGNKSDVKIWRKWFPEVNKIFFNTDTVSLRLSCLQWAANYQSMYWLIKIHFLVVIKVYYGMLYR